MFSSSPLYPTGVLGISSDEDEFLGFEMFDSGNYPGRKICKNLWFDLSWFFFFGWGSIKNGSV